MTMLCTLIRVQMSYTFFSWGAHVLLCQLLGGGGGGGGRCPGGECPTLGNTQSGYIAGGTRLKTTLNCRRYSIPLTLYAW